MTLTKLELKSQTAKLFARLYHLSGGIIDDWWYIEGKKRDWVVDINSFGVEISRFFVTLPL